MKHVHYLHRLLLSLAANEAVKRGYVTYEGVACDERNSRAEAWFEMLVDGDIPALVYVNQWYRDECIISIALWPAEGGREAMRNGGANANAGEAFARGWLNRWDQSGNIAIEDFADFEVFCSKARQARLLSIEHPDEHEDSLLLMRYSSKRAKGIQGQFDSLLLPAASAVVSAGAY
jgi:hypothetical protein